MKKILFVVLVLAALVLSACGGGSSGGGGCAIMPFGADPDVSLLLAVGVYWLRRRIVSTRGAA